MLTLIGKFVPAIVNGCPPDDITAEPRLDKLVKVELISEYRNVSRFFGMLASPTPVRNTLSLRFELISGFLTIVATI